MGSVLIFAGIADDEGVRDRLGFAILVKLLNIRKERRVRSMLHAMFKILGMLIFPQL